MNETKKPEEGKKGENKVFFNGGFYWIAAGAVILCAVVVWYSRVFSTLEGQCTFIGQSVLNVLIIAAIAVQALIYRRQWDSMAEGLKIERDKTNPRLRVADIRVQHFEAGKSPVFLVTIANGGLIDATGVELQIGIRMDEDTDVDWIDEQVVTIPARGQEVYPVFSTSQLEQQHIDGFNSTVPLKVVGHFTYSPVGRKEFCYKYQPRNIFGLPQFAPCDFEPRQNTTIRVQSIEVLAVADSVTATVQKNPPEEAKPQEETKPESKDDGENPN